MLSQKFLSTAVTVFVIPAQAGIQVFLCVSVASYFPYTRDPLTNDIVTVSTNLRDIIIALDVNSRIGMHDCNVATVTKTT
jgi:hypothetical protein